MVSTMNVARSLLRLVIATEVRLDDGVGLVVDLLVLVRLQKLDLVQACGSMWALT